MNLSDVLTVLTAEEARAAVGAAPISAPERRRHLQFIRHFPDAPFYANTDAYLTSFQEEEEVQLPAWMVTHLRTVAGAYPAEGSLHFRFTSFMPGCTAPLAERLGELWFSVNLLGWPSNRREANALKHAAPNVSLFPIGSERTEDTWQLAINVKARRDTGVYLYDLERVMGNVARGEDVMASVSPVFASLGDLLSRVAAIRHGQTVTEARAG
ncbi:SMI1/KNR4 family protein [Deinococcus ficus]|uniref:SMI1/KNR4 family protein n=1 Tax=Deinococcus ficus TaxID=317577 RepID=UPI0003B360F4|nr:SMI1/KNR4 family protein [Deinococcus ficus]